MSDLQTRRRRRRGGKPSATQHWLISALRKFSPPDGIAWVATGAVGLACLWFLAYLAIGDGGQLFGYVNAGGFWIGLAALIAGIVLAAKRLVIAATPGVVVGAIILWQGMAFGFGSAPTQSAHFRVVTASLRSLNSDMTSAARTLLAANPDVIVVQEARVDEFTADLASISGTEWHHAVRDNQAIACRCDILGSRIEGDILSADLALPGGTVRIWDLRAPKAYGNVIINQTYFATLASQMTAHPSGIAAGDFNATPWNDGYAMTAAVARDGWREGGTGPGFTFPTRYRHMGILMPFIQIDHVFLTGPFHAAHMRVIGASNGADHYPVVADIVRQPE